MSSEVRLSPRLRTVADAVLGGFAMADVGTDHGLLPVDLVTRGHVPRAIACDRAPAPLRRAARAAADRPDAAIELRHGDGFAPLSEVDALGTIVLAGMGGRTMVQILRRGPSAERLTRRLVLQPNNAWREVRAELDLRRWTLLDETLVRDAGKDYVVLVVDPRRPRARRWNEVDLELGPLLRERRPPAYLAFLERSLQRVETALARIRRWGRPEDTRAVQLERRSIRLRAELDAGPHSSGDHPVEYVGPDRGDRTR